MSESHETTAGPLSPDVESRPGLLRVVGPGIAISVVVGNVIGSGIYAMPGRIAAEAGDFPLIVAAWVTGGLLCLLGALCYAELAVMLPRAGGLYVYLREAYGRPVAFLYGWSDFVFGRPAAIGALAVIFASSLQQATGRNLPLPYEIGLAFGVILLMAWINVLGVLWGGGVQGIATALKAGFLALVAALPFLMPLFGGEGFDAGNYHSTLTAASGPRPLAETFAVVLLAVMWAYNGWHGITPLAEEVRDPQRNIPLALIGGIGLLIVLYVAANFAYHGVLTMDEMAIEKNQEHVAEVMVSRLAGPVGLKLVSASVMLSVLGAINANLLLGPRVPFAMGRDDVFFRGLGRVHVNYRTPAAAIVVMALMGMLLIAASALLVRYVDAFRDKNIFGLLTDFVVFSASIFYMLAVLAVIVLRYRHPDWERPYRTPGFPVTPIVYLLFYCWFLYYVYLGEPTKARIGLLLIGIGLPVYFAYRLWARQHPENVRDGQ